MKKRDLDIQTDTSNISFACLMDTGKTLFWYNFTYPDDLGGVSVNCVLCQDNRYIDTGFFLPIETINRLNNENYSSKFMLYSGYYKRKMLVYLTRKEKKTFKGFTFKVFTRRAVFKLRDIQFEEDYTWPLLNKMFLTDRKYLRGWKKGYVIKNIEILPE